MATTGRNTLKGWFKKWKKPTEAQFAAWIDSFWHKTEDSIPVSQIERLSEILADKIDRREIENITSRLLLERRLTFKVETSTIDLFIDEAMTIYKVAACNVSGLSLTIGEAETPIEIGADIEVGIPAGSIAVFNVERQLSDPVAYLYVYGRVNV